MVEVDGWRWRERSPVVEVDLRRIYQRHRRLIGTTMHNQVIFTGVVELARRGAISPVVAETFPLDQIHAAQESFERKDFIGKLVVIPPPV